METRKVQIKVKEVDLEYLEKLLKRKLPELSKLSAKEKEVLCFEVFGKSLLKEIKSKLVIANKEIQDKLSRVNIQLKNGGIYVSQNVKSTIKGLLKNRYRETEKEVLLETNPILVIEPIAMKETTLVYNIEVKEVSLNEDLEKTSKNKERYQWHTLDINEDEVLKVKQVQDLELWQRILPETLNYRPNEKMLLEDFIEVLHERGMFKLTGQETVFMKIINERAKNLYPKYKELSVSKKVKLLNRIVKRVRNKDIDATKGIYLFAKVTFETLCEEGLTTEFINNSITYKCVRTIPKSHGDKLYIYEYFYNGKKLETSFFSQDLYSMLVLKKRRR